MYFSFLLYDLENTIYHRHGNFRVTRRSIKKSDNQSDATFDCVTLRDELKSHVERSTADFIPFVRQHVLLEWKDEKRSLEKGREKSFPPVRASARIEER